MTDRHVTQAERQVAAERYFAQCLFHEARRQGDLDQRVIITSEDPNDTDDVRKFVSNLFNNPDSIDPADAQRKQANK